MTASLRGTMELLARALPDAPRRRVGVVAGTGTQRELRAALRFLASRGVDDEAVVRAFERDFAAAAGCPQAFAFGAGRMALYALLVAAGIGPGDEVVVPAFTCVVVPNAVRYAGAKPIFADIEPGTFNVDVDAVAAAIGPRTRAIVMQHTFGVTADVAALRALAQRHGIALYEDAAHSLGATFGDLPHGALGDAAYFSIDRTKVVGAQCGGVVTTTNDDLAARLAAVRDRTPFPSRALARRMSRAWVFEYVLNAPALRWIGRPLLGALRRLGLLFEFGDELATERPARPDWPCRLPAGNATIGALQLEGLAANLAHRRRIAHHLEERVGWHRLHGRGAFHEQAWLRYSFLVRDRAKVERLFADRFDLGVWFTHNIFGRPTNTEAVGYRSGSCPVAEAVARHVINFPTHPRVGLAFLAESWRRHEEHVLRDVLTPAELTSTIAVP